MNVTFGVSTSNNAGISKIYEKTGGITILNIYVPQSLGNTNLALYLLLANRKPSMLIQKLDPEKDQDE